MKKKILFLLITALLVVVMTLTASAMHTDKLVTNNGGHTFEFEMTEDGIMVSGIVNDKEIKYAAISLDKNYIINITPEIRFSAVIKYPENASKTIKLRLYLGTDVEEEFTGVFNGDDVVLTKSGDEWHFVLNDSVYNNNAEWLSGWIDESVHLNTNQPSAVKMVTSTVIKDLKTDYEKAFAIHKWVVQNIYYDKDYALNKKSYTALTPVEVLTDRVSVCEGYAKLTVAMLNSAGIPAFTVKGYTLGVDGPTAWSDVPVDISSNHMWVEAYVDGRWLIMDTTWDCKNMSYGGKKEKNSSIVYRHFDMSEQFLATSHRIIDRPNAFGKNGVSAWAEAETQAAYKNKLVTPEICNAMQSNMTREEFCDLVVNLVSIKLGKPIEKVLEDKGLTLNRNAFKDRADDNILAANALGIVNGKENNMFDAIGYITRQEAAVMLYRTAKVLGAVTPNSTSLEFADADAFPDWSKDAIDFVSASLSSEGTRVMGGVQNNKFNPTGYYTREQSVLTIYRLFRTY